MARSCLEAQRHRAKMLPSTPQHSTSGTGVPLGTVVPLGCPAKCAGLVGVGHATWVRFRGTFVRRFSAAFLAFLALLSAKCCSSFRFFNKIPKNIARCCISKKYAKRGRFDPSLTQLIVEIGEKIGQTGAKNGAK